MSNRRSLGETRRLSHPQVNADENIVVCDCIAVIVSLSVVANRCDVIVLVSLLLSSQAAARRLMRKRHE